MYNFDLRPLIWMGLIAGLGIMGILWVIFSLFSSSDIVTDKPLTPELKLTVENNKIDTLYIYKKP
jgi:hypothetical protein